MNHVFEGSYRKRQVGNAVPPRVAKVLFKHIKKVLDERDGLVEERDAIVLDD
jgi:DNA (cytosine-5)-methyltransferase 1